MESSSESLPHSDELLRRRCQQGEAAAWNELVSRYARLVYSVGRSCGLPDADAADVAQVTFRILFDNLDRLQPDSRLGHWLATVARRHSWRALGQRRRESPEEAETLARRADALGAEGTANTAPWELLEWLHHGLGQLDARCRELLTSLYLEPDAPSYETVARRLEIPLGSVGPTRARCLEKMRSALKTGEEQRPRAEH